MDYYRDLITQKSWQTLIKLQQDYSLVLIGGWAIWLYSHQLKSKDIDFVVDLPTLSQLKERFTVTKNNRLHKYEIVQNDIQVDIYVPFWSEIGLPCEEIIAASQIREGFRVPLPEILLILKQVSQAARAGSVKGYKDLLDVISLLRLPDFNWDRYRRLTHNANPQLPQKLADLLRQTVQVPELSLNAHQFSRIKKTWLLNLASFR